MKVKGITKMKDLQAADDRTEEQIQTEILQYLATIPLHRGFFYRSSVAKKRGHRKGNEAGQPDIVGFYNTGFNPAIYIGLEVKRPKGVLSKSQLKFQNNCDRSGAIFRVVHSVEEAMAVIEEVSG